ncbi:MAG: hypothetical protein JNL69_07935 [Bacteroidia bacterium]|nr:hypothetical protein [Bacteroidia bacterium]
MSKPSLSFFLGLEKQNSKNGKIPVYLRIIANREKSDIRIPLEIEPELLPLWDNSFMRFREPIAELNRILNKYQKMFDDMLYLNAEKLYQLSAKNIRNELIGKNETGQMSIVEMFEKYFNDKIDKNTGKPFE